ncbi:MAG: hypothetical protein AABX04_06825 [Nanoarchaeota archaeon]
MTKSHLGKMQLWGTGKAHWDITDNPYFQPDPVPDNPPAEPAVPPATAPDVPPVTAISTAPIELTDIVLYDMRGKPYRQYKRVILDGEAAKDANEQHLLLTQDQALAYHQQRTPKYDVPSTALWAAMLRKMQEVHHPGLAGVVKDLKESWLATSTRIDYAHNKVVHELGNNPYSIDINLPAEGWMKESKYQNAVKALTGTKDVAVALAELEQASGKPAYLWTPDADGRKVLPERASWLNLIDYRLNFSCFDDLYDSGRSRGVRRE